MDYQPFPRHSYARDLKYFGLGLLVSLALSALAFIAGYEVIKSAKQAREPIGIEFCEGKPDLGSLINSAK